MFISQRRGTLSLVRQDDHMAQTAEIASNWSNSWFLDSQERQTLVAAMAVHDAGWTQADDEVLYNPETRRPRNFMHVAIREHANFYRAGYERALRAGDGSGLLVGMHWIGLYTSRFGLEPELKFRIPEQDKDFVEDAVLSNQKEWIDLKHRMWSTSTRRAQFEDRIWKQFEVFEVIDRMSIALCMSDLGMPKSVSLGDVRMASNEPQAVSVDIIGDGTAVVSPFLFESEFSAPIVRRFIPDEDYDSQSDAARSVHSATSTIEDCRFVSP